MLKGEKGPSGSPLFHSGLVAGDGLSRVHTSTVAVHTLKVGVAQRGKGRYPPGGVEGKELLQRREEEKWWNRLKSRDEHLSSTVFLQFYVIKKYGWIWDNKDGTMNWECVTIKRARPCSSISGTKFSIGLGGLGVKALCGRATSWGQSSAEGTPTTLWDNNGCQHLYHQLRQLSLPL